MTASDDLGERMLAAVERVYNDGFGRWRSTDDMLQDIAAAATRVAEDARHAPAPKPPPDTSWIKMTEIKDGL